MEQKIRKRFRLYGIVQGIGFRPFVSILAKEYDLYGSVCNKGSYVEIYGQSSAEKLEAFQQDLEKKAPDRSFIVKVEVKELPLVEEVQMITGEKSDANNGRFNIITSKKEVGMVFVSPDIATCDQCMEELYEPGNPRYLHPFINCTACGPRLTIVDAMPYDRERTSMEPFPMCEHCNYEYTHATTRRYHAQPVCCNDCGPKLYAIGTQLTQDHQVMLYARKRLRQGEIIAIKGIGGFHLCCDGTNELAVAKLRQLKHRPKKPFAVMMRNLEVVQRECKVLPEQVKMITGPQKPILLLEKAKEGSMAPSVAPDNPNVGVMLPYAPVQMLLFNYPGDDPMPDVLVMTSGNPKGAPIAMTDEEAIKYLRPMTAAIVSNPREIRIRADDSVMSWYNHKPYMIRRSRGYAPLPVMVKQEAKRKVLAIGGELKNTFALAAQDLYYLSPYIGDMASLRSIQALEAGIKRLEGLLEIKPDLVVCDLHPKYNTSAFARELGLPVVEVQHHYAHILSCMAENNHLDEVIGVAFDGTGYGLDHTIWGGEFLRCSTTEFTRVGHLRDFRQAGGERSSIEGWRNGVSLVLDAYGMEQGPSYCQQLNLGESKERKVQIAMVEQMINAVKSTSAGRIFDGVSAILGVQSHSTFEGEASMRLEFAAEGYEQQKRQEQEKMNWNGDHTMIKQVEDKYLEMEGYSYELVESGQEFVLDERPMVRQLVEGRLTGEDVGGLAYRFHYTLAQMIVDGCEKTRQDCGLTTVALSGGVFQNILLLDITKKMLEANGFSVLTHSLVPANDGGIALGQALYGMALEQQEE